MRTTETFSIIIVEPIASQAELEAAKQAAELLADAEPGSADESKRSRIAEMIRNYEQRGRKAMRHAGEVSAEWTGDHRSGLGWLAGGVATLAAGLGIARWRRSRQPKSLRDRIGSFTESSSERVGKVGRAGWKGAKKRVKAMR